MTVVKRVFTGIKPTGEMHLGNYIGFVDSLLKNPDAILMIADAHAITTPVNAIEQKSMTFQLVCGLLACGLSSVSFYLQSQVLEIFQIYWVLNCFCSKGLLDRGHVFKSINVQNVNVERASSVDKYGAMVDMERLSSVDKYEAVVDMERSINVGTYTYATLMAADILAMQATHVPVGADQKQHIEICRDILAKIHHFAGREILPMPNIVDAKLPTLLGIDGRKMSKSYNNTLPLFAELDEIKHKIYRIPTTSQGIKEAKEPEILYAIYSAIASVEKAQDLLKRYESGIGWKEVKDMVFDEWVNFTADKREGYEYWTNNQIEVERVLLIGAQKARGIAGETRDKLLELMGLL